MLQADFHRFLCFIYTQGFTTSCKSISNAVSVQSARKSQCWCVMIISIKKKPVTSVLEVKSLYFLARASENILSILFVELCAFEISDEWILQTYSALQLLVVCKIKSALLERISYPRDTFIMMTFNTLLIIHKYLGERMRSRSADFILWTTNSCKAKWLCKIHSSQASEAHSLAKRMHSMFSAALARKYKLLKLRACISSPEHLKTY